MLFAAAFTATVQVSFSFHSLLGLNFAALVAYFNFSRDMMGAYRGSREKSMDPDPCIDQSSRRPDPKSHFESFGQPGVRTYQSFTKA